MKLPMDIKHSFFSGMELGDSESTTLTQYYLVQVCVCTLFFFFVQLCVRALFSWETHSSG